MPKELFKQTQIKGIFSHPGPGELLRGLCVTPSCALPATQENGNAEFLSSSQFLGTGFGQFPGSSETQVQCGS